MSKWTDKARADLAGGSVRWTDRARADIMQTTAQPTQMTHAQRVARRDDGATRDHFAQTHPEYTGGVEGARTRQANTAVVQAQSQVNAAQKKLEAAEANLTPPALRATPPIVGGAKGGALPEGVSVADPRSMTGPVWQSYLAAAKDQAKADQAVKKAKGTLKDAEEALGYAQTQKADLDRERELLADVSTSRWDQLIRDKYADTDVSGVVSEEEVRSQRIKAKKGMLQAAMSKARGEMDAASQRLTAYDYGVRYQEDGAQVSREELDAAYQAAKAEYDKLEADLNWLSRRDYSARNESGFERLATDQEAAGKYADAAKVKEDQQKLYEVIGYYQKGQGGSPEEYERISKMREELLKDYGLSEASIAAYVGGYEPYSGEASVQQVMERMDALLSTQKEALAQTEGRKAGYDFEDLYGYQQRVEKQQEAAQLAEENAKFAREHPVMSSVGTVLASPLQAVDLLNMDWGKGKPGDVGYVPPDTSGMAVTNFIQTVRGTIAQDLERNTDWELWGQNVPAFLYNTGMSMADSALAVSTLGTGSVYLMGLNSAVNTAKEVVDNGGTTQQALKLGLASGAAEILFEKFSVDSLLKPRTAQDWRDVLKQYVVQQGLVELSEEALTETANILAEVSILGQSSDYAKAVEGYRRAGDSEATAKQKAFLDMAGRVGWAGAGGFVSGAGMGAGKAAVDYAGSRLGDFDIRTLFERGRAAMGLGTAQEAGDGSGAGVDTPGAQTGENGAETAQDVPLLLKPALEAERNAYARNFRQAVDNWNGKSKVTFQVGRTSDTLQSIGVKNQMVRLQSDKVNGIQEKHPGTTIEIIKQAPDILESPVLVAKSKTHDTRIVVFGDVFDKNGAPVLAALELQPTTEGGEIIDVINLASLYGKDHNPADFIRTSDIVFLDPDEKRTKTWLQSVGLQLPSDAIKLGPVGSVTYQDGKVKIDGKPVLLGATENGAPLFKSETAETGKLLRNDAPLDGPADTTPDAGVSTAPAHNAQSAPPQGPSIDSIPQTPPDVKPDGDDGPVGVGAAERGFAGAYDRLQGETPASGFHPDGENAYRQQDVPMRDFDGRAIPKSAATVMEAQATPDGALGQIQEMIASGALSFDSITDKGALRRAEGEIRNTGYQKALGAWLEQTRRGVTSKDLVVKGQVLLNSAMNARATGDVVQILSAYTRLSTRAAQAMQAQRVLKKLSPEWQLYAVQQSIASYQEELNARLGEDAPTVTVDQDLYDAYVAASEPQEREAALMDIYQAVADQIPATFAEKWTAWRYLSMLGNPRTHIRNIVGNAGFAPVRGVKNAIAWGMENAVDIASKAAGGMGIEKTKAMIVPVLSRLNAQDGALVSACYQDLANVEEQLLGAGKYAQSAQGQIDQRRTVFKTKPLEAVRKANSAALDAEDTWFSRPVYAGALAGYLKAHKVTAQMLTEGTVKAETLDAARAYAVREAQKATYRDANAFSDLVARLGRLGEGKGKAGKAAHVLVEGVLPFKRTPANILARGVEYSPAGLVKGLTYDLVQVKNGNMTAAQAIDDISAGLTGTGLLALGFWLASMGLVTGGGGEEPEDQLRDLTGGQDYALTLPGGASVTLDWLAPEALPFFVGVEAFNYAQDHTDGAVDWKAVESAAVQITDPVMEMSMLQGLQDAVNEVKFSDDGLLLRLAANAGLSYLTQGVPTLFGQLERTAESERQSTYVDRQSGIPKEVQWMLGKVMNKLPGEFSQIPYIDAWGRREETGTALERAVNNLLNPAYGSRENKTPVDDEIGRLLEAGQTGVVPQRPAQSVKIGKEYLSAEEYVAYAEEKGQLSYQLVSDLIADGAYKAMSDADKAKAISDAYGYANAMAKKKVKPQYEIPSEYAKAKRMLDAGLSLGEWLAMRSGADADDNDRTSRDELVAYIDAHVPKGRRRAVFDAYKGQQKWKNPY